MFSLKSKTNPFLSLSLLQRSMAGQLYFPTAEECDSSVTPTRQITVPVTFEDVMQYKQVFKAALRGELSAIHRSTLLLSLINPFWFWSK